MITKKKITAAMLFLFWTVCLNSLAHAAHGCLNNEPDRDQDGVPDKEDPNPDDPTLGGLAEKYCGAEPLTLKMFFIPFSADIREPITKDSIESKKARAIWFCSKNQAGDSILGILEPALQGASPDAGLAAGKTSPNHIRLKVAIVTMGVDDEAYFVDKFGLGTKGGKAFNLNPDQMAQLEAAVKNMKCGGESKTHCEMSESQV